jgi:hypothetical protein
MKGEEMHDIFVRVFKTPKELVAKLGEASQLQPDLKVIDAKPEAKPESK